MKFTDLLNLVADEPLFDTALLLAGDVRRQDVQRELTRWERNGRLFQVRRGLYTLAPPYQHVTPHPFLTANRMVKGSYVSCQSALAWYGLIPEYTPVTVSVTTLRPGTWNTALGRFIFRHVKPDLLWGYVALDVTPGQQAFVARPEKALLDLIHLTPGADQQIYLDELRLQNLERLEPQRLVEYARRAKRPKLERAVDLLLTMLDTQPDYEAL